MSVMQFLIVAIMAAASLALMTSVDLMGIAEKFGYPTALLVLFMLIARRLVYQERKDRNDYRDAMLKAQTEQIEYLRELAREQKCFYFKKDGE